MKDELELKEFVEMVHMANAIWEQHGIDAVEIVGQMVDEHERELKKLFASHIIVNKANEVE